MAIITCFLISITRAPARSSCHRRHTMIIHQRVAIVVVVLLMLLLLKLHPSKIVNASPSTHVSIKTTLWLLPVAVPSTCKSIFLLQHDHLIHPIYHITSLAISHHKHTLQKQVRRPLIVVGSFTWLVWVSSKNASYLCDNHNVDMPMLFSLHKDPFHRIQFD